MGFKDKARESFKRVAHHEIPPQSSVAAIDSSSVYTALNRGRREIRVLEIHPGSGKDVVEGTLHVRSLPTTAVAVCRQSLQQLRNSAKGDSKKCFALLATAVQAVHHFKENFTRESEERGPDDPDFSFEGPKMCVLLETLDEMRKLVYDSLPPASVDHFDEETAKYGDMLKDMAKTLEAYVGTYRDIASSLRHIFRPPERWAGVDQIEYEAISYCWGEPRGELPMMLNGQPFEAPVSAIEVLQRFRHPKKRRNVWIDAICIDQGNLEEKQFQIPMMADIYHSATRTLAWLGDITGGSLVLAAPLCQRIATFLTKDEVSSRLYIVGLRTKFCDWLELREIEPRSVLSMVV